MSSVFKGIEINLLRKEKMIKSLKQVVFFASRQVANRAGDLKASRFWGVYGVFFLLLSFINGSEIKEQINRHQLNN